MRWPWSRNGAAVEERSGYTGLVVDALLGAAGGRAADAAKSFAVETVAGTLGRIMSAAAVEGSDRARRALSPDVLAAMAYDAVRHGESLHVLTAGGGGLRLVRASEWEWTGRGGDPAKWAARVTVPSPTESATRTVPAADLVAVRWGSSAFEPWKGIPGHVRASETARMAAEAEKAVADEAGGPVGSLVPLPEEAGDTSAVKTAIAKLRGGVAMPPTTAGGLGAGPGAAPQRDWRPDRIGAAFNDALVRAHRQAAEGVAASLGYPPALLFGDADGTAQRESLRRLHLQLVLPFTRRVESELSEKLETDVKLAHDSYALDMVSRASVVDRLVRAGVPVATALAAVGLE